MSARSFMLNRGGFCALVAGFGLARAFADTRKIRVAVVGTGHAHALSKIRCLRSLPEYEFAGICRPDADEPDQGEVFQGVRWLSLGEVLNDASIELVAVESRVQHNLPYAR